jgi:hypothetical protein
MRSPWDWFYLKNWADATHATIGDDAISQTGVDAPATFALASCVKETGDGPLSVQCSNPRAGKASLTAPPSRR